MPDHILTHKIKVSTELIELQNLGVERSKGKRVIYNRLGTYEVMIWFYLSNIDFLI